MGSVGRRLARLERRSGLDDALLQEAADLAVTEALKRVSDGDLDAFAAVAERMPDVSGEEFSGVVREEHPEAWRRFEALCEEVVVETLELPAGEGLRGGRLWGA